MATPHATGVAALAASEWTGLYTRPLSLKKHVMANGEPARFTKGKTVTGRIVDADGVLIRRPARR